MATLTNHYQLEEEGDGSNNIAIANDVIYETITDTTLGDVTGAAWTGARDTVGSLGYGIQSTSGYSRINGIYTNNSSGTAFSLNYWMKHDDFDTALYISSGWRLLADSSSSHIVITDSGNISVSTSGTDDSVALTDTLPTDTFYMLTITRNTSNAWKFYVNGALQSATFTRAGSYAVQYICSGRDSTANPIGTYADYRFYLGELSQSEIDALYALGSSGTGHFRSPGRAVGSAAGRSPTYIQ